MNAQNKNQTFAQFEKFTKVATLIAAYALLSACGSSIQSKSVTSTSGVPSVVGTVDSSGSLGTQCNGFDSTNGRLSGRLTTDVVNGQIQQDKVRLRITSLDSKFDTSSTAYVKFFRWQVAADGTTTLDSNPLEFTVETGTNFVKTISNRLTQISLNDVASLRTANFISGTTSIDFFANTAIVLQNVGYDWSAVKVVLYDGTSTVATADALMPVFTANPNTYATNHSSILAALHPMWNRRADNISDSDWVSRFSGYCF